MDHVASKENCPSCGGSSTISSKLLLIDAAYDSLDADPVDGRAYYKRAVRVSDFDIDKIQAKPLDQFVSGYYCNQCHKGFISDDNIRKDGWETIGLRRYPI